MNKVWWLILEQVWLILGACVILAVIMAAVVVVTILMAAASVVM